ncbi:YihY/virulence factor BrkB family protein [Macrococcus carouselicus]|uniref:YihY/virulence factor BrkB family protein n=1 Tax=Macrococcus carouselicus TaxID=69969 RepID=A0A9Q8CHM9_9STAP|nr:YihY/virulence factor BrkB family protein [Macrococcus carouselicus]TDM00749.1 YihY/virulence factor BrkB family protein [Macrococcus carouselicus]
MAKDQKSSSKFLTQTANPSESSHLEENYVETQQFQSKDAKKPDEEFHVSKINKPVKYKEEGNFFQRLLYRIGKDDAAGLSAQLAYYFLLSLFPLLIFLLTLLPLFKLKPETITDFIAKSAPGDTADTINTIITDVMANSNGGLLSFGLIAALWTASNGMTALMNAFNVSYEIEDARSPLKAKLLSILFTIVMILVVAITLALPVFGEQLGQLLFGAIGMGDQFIWLFNLIKVVLPLILTFVVFTTLYAIAPNIRLNWKSVLPGALFATIVWLGASFLFGVYVNNFANYSKTYGSIGGVIVLMTWLYLTGFIIIVGSQINAILHQKKLGQLPTER